MGETKSTNAPLQINPSI